MEEYIVKSKNGKRKEIKLQHQVKPDKISKQGVKMERRKFIKGAAATSAFALTGAFPTKAQESKKKEFKCKITVLRRTFHPDLNEKYQGDKGALCSRLKEGEEFIVHSLFSVPEGFCEWAWADIRLYIMWVYGGHEKPCLACCTDGNRSVIFKIERVEV